MRHASTLIKIDISETNAYHQLPLCDEQQYVHQFRPEW
jgi:hypothetical protein